MCGFPGALKYFEVLDGNYKYNEALSRFYKCLQAIDRYKHHQILVRHSADIINMGNCLTIIIAISIDLVSTVVMN